MYGQTNCWVLPEGQYGAYRGLNNEIYVMTHRSALNLSYQDRMPVTGQPECLMSLLGQDLIGTPLNVSSTAFINLGCHVLVLSAASVLQEFNRNIQCSYSTPH